MRKELVFETFTEFCDRADEILLAFTMDIIIGRITIRRYKNYVYYEHNFSEVVERDMLVKDKIWMWLMSYKYEPMEKNVLYSTLGQIKKGR